MPASRFSAFQQGRGRRAQQRAGFAGDDAAVGQLNGSRRGRRSMAFGTGGGLCLHRAVARGDARLVHQQLELDAVLASTKPLTCWSQQAVL